MKFLPCVVLVLLILCATAPDNSEAVSPAWFAAVAAKLTVELIKNAYYARCNTRNVPAGIDCPGVVYGMGFSRNQAQNAARVYARTFGDSQCGRYVSHCQINRYRGKKGK